MKTTPSLPRRRFLRHLATLPLLALPACIAPNAANPRRAKTILFLGDSITWAGTWVVHVECWLRLAEPTLQAEVINLGLPSETVSGLSEPGHAGGAFPRPDLHERLGRALEKVRPDLVVACYGMNDGIYHPWSEERGPRHFDGLQRLHDAVAAAGASIVHLTPPVFDPLPLAGRTLPGGRDAYPQPYEGYDDVLARFDAWLVQQGQSKGWNVVPVHQPMREFIAQARRADPRFVLAGDGVHPGPLGHWLMARQLIRHWGGADSLVRSDSPDAVVAALQPKGPAMVALVTRRQNLLRDAWLSHVGHKRPGMATGMPLEQAQAEAARLKVEMAALLAPGR